MLERIYDQLTLLGLPDIAARAILTAALCIPLVMLTLAMPTFLGGSRAQTQTVSAASEKKPSSKASEDNPIIQADALKREFAKVKEGMTQKQVLAIMGEGEIVVEDPTQTAGVRSWSYADGTIQVVMFADGKVLDISTKKFKK